MINLNDPHEFPEILEGKRHFFDISLSPPPLRGFEYDAEEPDPDDDSGKMKYFNRRKVSSPAYLMRQRRRQSKK